MVNQRNIKVNLPTATGATPDTTRSLVNIAVDKSGVAYVEGRPIGNNELVANLAALQKTNTNPRVFVRGDRDARHGDVIRVLDLVRSAGIDKIAFEIREPAGGSQ